MKGKLYNAVTIPLSLINIQPHVTTELVAQYFVLILTRMNTNVNLKSG